jgi:hypothetical protein
MSSNVLADKDINAPATNGAPADGVKDVKSMEYHRQVLQSKLNEDQYVLPVSDSPPQFQLLTNPPQRKANIHLAFGQHHEPLHSKAERLPE